MTGLEDRDFDNGNLAYEWKYRIACECKTAFLPTPEEIERGEAVCPTCGAVYVHKGGN